MALPPPNDDEDAFLAAILAAREFEPGVGAARRDHGSEVLAVCVAATPETRGLVDAALLAALGPSGIVINIARGSVVNEPDLIAALRSDGIAAAGLDVFETEPRIRETFLSLPNVVLTPHQASATVETRIAMGEAVLANLAAHFAGARPPALVN